MSKIQASSIITSTAFGAALNARDAKFGSQVATTDKLAKLEPRQWAQETTSNSNPLSGVPREFLVFLRQEHMAARIDSVVAHIFLLPIGERTEHNDAKSRGRNLKNEEVAWEEDRLPTLSYASMCQGRGTPKSFPSEVYLKFRQSLTTIHSWLLPAQGNLRVAGWNKRTHSPKESLARLE